MLASATLATACFLSHAPQANAEEFFARFSGFQEVGGLGAGETGAIFSPGKASLKLDLNEKAKTLTFTLTYSDLGAAVTQSHIHFGKIHVAGGIIVFFCSNLANPPPGTQPCPGNGGTVTGTLTAGNVVGPNAQNVTPGNFDALVAALESDTAYGNIHTTAFPAGEIRGQIRRGEREDDQREHDQ
jgi:hypothetical protein